MTSRVYTVEGMTSGHCVATVVAEVVKLAGVTDADLDLGSATLRR